MPAKSISNIYIGKEYFLLLKAVLWTKKMQIWFKMILIAWNALMVSLLLITRISQYLSTMWRLLYQYLNQYWCRHYNKYTRSHWFEVIMLRISYHHNGFENQTGKHYELQFTLFTNHISPYVHFGTK